mmetsp:Transcript_22716/g.33541  ORF Transcript_22716/g.33541 Transcript_22716/m.33541 type:complete len:102 (+) Transcript_22716:136-441(+)|eukprot:CAMPEP_0194223966 /NCGR_PEP_ID=MMETSP0156-20130528/36372_1 /TAXON_ID=33649 /ORGANISM="Thalassionema nitzschioides, Strain L26-B" /LENGTH=101 /DNA_ID=CAMNT_0038955323 /DNA_START=80 /DNA_END=385 /DNA_ORIENTATION=-
MVQSFLSAYTKNVSTSVTANGASDVKATYIVEKAPSSYPMRRMSTPPPTNTSSNSSSTILRRAILSMTNMQDYIDNNSSSRRQRQPSVVGVEVFSIFSSLD